MENVNFPVVWPKIHWDKTLLSMKYASCFSVSKRYFFSLSFSSFFKMLETWFWNKSNISGLLTQNYKIGFCSRFRLSLCEKCQKYISHTPQDGFWKTPKTWFSRKINLSKVHTKIYFHFFSKLTRKPVIESFSASEWHRRWT